MKAAPSKRRRFNAKNKEFDVADKIERTKKEGRIKRWWRETIGELRKVNWPTPKEAWRLTKIVIMVILAMGLLLGGLDFGFTKLMGLFFG
jgi:preprotein translocase subunit SecE